MVSRTIGSRRTARSDSPASSAIPFTHWATFIYRSTIVYRSRPNSRRPGAVASGHHAAVRAPSPGC